jgi:hypothetical protein
MVATNILVTFEWVNYLKGEGDTRCRECLWG